MDKDKKLEEERLKKYKDLSGLSVREMNFGLWVAEHRRLITRSTTIFLILISAFFFIYSTYAYIIYFMRGPIDNQPENQVLSPRKVVDDIIIGPIMSFRSGSSSDLAVEITNPNDNFWAEFRYCFYQGETSIYCERSFLLPSEKKHTFALGVDLPGSGVVSFKIDDIFWSRINRHQIADWSVFLAERTDFEFYDIQFLNSSKSGLSELVKFNTLEFSAYNHSAFNFYELPIEILMYSGSQIVGVDRYIIKEFMAGERRSIKISWAGDVSAISEIKISPRVNVIDDNVYLKYGSTIQ